MLFLSLLFALIISFSSVKPARGVSINEQLLVAAENNDLAHLKNCLEGGADVNFADEVAYTALMNASIDGHVEIVRHLLSQEGINLNLFCKTVDETALMTAVLMGHVEVVKLLIGHEGIDANAADKKNRTAIFFALENAEVMEILLSSEKFDLNHRDESGKTVLEKCTDPKIRSMIEAAAAVGPSTSSQEKEIISESTTWLKIVIIVVIIVSIVCGISYYWYKRKGSNDSLLLK